MNRGNGLGTDLSIFVALPFCRHKCSYCDLNAYAGQDHLIPAYVEALLKEVRLIGRQTETAVHTLYFGGGTPSLIPVNLLAGLFASIRESFATTSDLEITFEANPENLVPVYLAQLLRLGVSRLSIGAQSAQPLELELFQRTHTFDDVEDAVASARRAGFVNISLDLIFGVPGQTLAGWRDTLARALALRPEHFSIYALSYDFNTPMRAWIRRGLLAEPDGDLAADMYEWAGEDLAAAGYEQYEISSWALGGEAAMDRDAPVSNPYWACRHNLQYWRNRPYIGLGAGAHGYVGTCRYANVASPAAYVDRMQLYNRAPFPFSSALLSSVEIDPQTEMGETMFTGLRLLCEGVNAANFRARFGLDLAEAFGPEIDGLVRRGLVHKDDTCLRLTKQARLVSNWVFEVFV